MTKLSPKVAVMALLISCIAIATIAQEKEKKNDDEQKAVNLKVLSKKISHDSLIVIMREYSAALGVKCGFCHAKSAANPDKLDFASDDNGHKKVARYMISMTEKINKKYFAEENYGSSRLMVSCYTCHHGKPEPESFVMKKEEKKN